MCHRSYDRTRPATLYTAHTIPHYVSPCPFHCLLSSRVVRGTVFDGRSKLSTRILHGVRDEFSSRLTTDPPWYLKGRTPRQEVPRSRLLKSWRENKEKIGGPIHDHEHISVLQEERNNGRFYLHLLLRHVLLRKAP